MHWEENTWRKVWAMFLLELGLPYYEVIQATRRSSHLESKGNIFISQLHYISKLFKGSNCRPPTLQSSALPVKVVLSWLCGLRILFSLSNVISILVTLVLRFVIICWCNFYNRWSCYSLCISGKATRVGAVPGITTSIENRVKVTLYCCHIN